MELRNRWTKNGTEPPSLLLIARLPGFHWLRKITTDFLLIKVSGGKGGRGYPKLYKYKKASEVELN